MYESFDRRRTPRVVEAQARQVPVAAHRGSALDYLGRLEAAAQHAGRDHAARRTYCCELFDTTTDERNLATAWGYLASGSGQAPGIDGLRYSDVPISDLWNFMRGLREELRSGEFTPSPLKRVEIPRPDGRTRTLELPVIVDRTAGRAAVQTIQPLVDPLFDPRSLGFRPGCGRMEALATAEALATHEGRWILVVDDLKDAFPSTPRNRLLDVVRKCLRNEQMVDLISKLTENGRPQGIPQGQPLCPLLLNMYLDHALDKRWRKAHPTTPLLRVADDLLLLCQSREEANEAHASLRQTTTACGYQLKGGTPADLTAGQSTDWLGFHLRKEGAQLKVDIGEKAWKKLELHLTGCHSEPASPIKAAESVLGWIHQMGPTFQGDDSIGDIRRILTLGQQLSFEELPPSESLAKAWQQAYARWESLKRKTLAQVQA